MKNKIVGLLVILFIVCLLGVFSTIFQKDILDFLTKNYNVNVNETVQEKLSVSEIMDIIKTDKDYNDLSKFVTGFNPEIIDYIKLGPNEYKKIKPDWQKQGLGDRVKMVDKLNLNDSTYWIELKNKSEETKGLRMILDTKDKKSLILIAALSIKAGIGI